MSKNMPVFWQLISFILCTVHQDDAFVNDWCPHPTKSCPNPFPETYVNVYDAHEDKFYVDLNTTNALVI